MNTKNDSFLNQEAEQDQDVNVDEEAFRWYLRLHADECTKEDVSNYERWLERDQAHRIAYGALERELQNIWQITGSFSNQPEINAMRKQALLRGSLLNEEANKQTVSGARIRGKTSSLTRENKLRRWIPMALAASLLCVVFIANQDKFNIINDGIYQTEIGELQTITLDDGSRVILDTQTKVTAQYSDQLRHITLNQGQARFSVVKDSSRPFIVDVGSGKVTALGTEFVIKKESGNILVTLIEGEVSVINEKLVPQVDPPELQQVALNDREVKADIQSTPEYDETSTVFTTRADVKNPFNSEVKLLPGQQVAFNSTGMSQATDANLELVTSWQSGRLIFENHTLAEVLDNLNRYSKSQIMLGDDSLADIRITGVFKTGDNTRIVHTLKTYFSMRVSSDRYGNLILKPTTRTPSS
jgi:transmembrane sensor